MSSRSALYHVMGPILILQLSWVCLCSGYIPGLHIRLDLGRAPADGNSNHFRALWEIAVSIFPLTQKYSCFFFFPQTFLPLPSFLTQPTRTYCMLLSYSLQDFLTLCISSAAKRTPIALTETDSSVQCQGVALRHWMAYLST